MDPGLNLNQDKGRKKTICEKVYFRDGQFKNVWKTGQMLQNFFVVPTPLLLFWAPLMRVTNIEGNVGH
jgi:hypothetical protein